VAEIVADAVAETAVVLTVKVAELELAGTVTDAGRVALPLPEESDTVAPPGPAAPFKVTVPVEEVPPVTEVGDRLTPLSVAEVIVSVAVSVVLPNVAEIVAVTALDTALVLVVKVAEELPAATVTEEGTIALEEFDDRLTIVPPVGAFPLSVTVPVAETPPKTVVGDTDSELSDGALTVSEAVIVTAAAVAEIVAVAFVATGIVATLNVAEVAPAATGTVEGTVTPVVSEESVTTVPAVGAGALSVIVPMAEAPPMTEVGEMAKLTGCGAFNNLLTNPVKIIVPQPDAVSHPGPATDWLPLGNVPLLP